MENKEEDFDKAFQEMLDALKELPDDVLSQLNKNLDEMKKDNKVNKGKETKKDNKSKKNKKN